MNINEQGVDILRLPQTALQDILRMIVVGDTNPHCAAETTLTAIVKPDSRCWRPWQKPRQNVWHAQLVKNYRDGRVWYIASYVNLCSFHHASLQHVKTRDGDIFQKPDQIQNPEPCAVMEEEGAGGGGLGTRALDPISFICHAVFGKNRAN